MSNNNPKNGPAKAVLASAAPKPAVAVPAGKGTATAPSSSPAAKPVVPLHVPPLFRRIDWISFAITFFLTLVGYLYTLAPDLTLEDCGELATGSFYAGVPHPPGYPVWTVYTWVFTWLVPVGNIAYRVAISSAFAGALACGLVALMVSRGSSMILEGISDLKNIEKRWENPLCLVCGFVAGMVIGFNGFMWSQAVIVEVYTLSALSMTGVLCCMLRWIYAPHQRRYLYMAFFWFGICFNNHQSLLVISLGMEAAILCAAPRVARTMFMGNWLIWLFGLWFKGIGMIGMLSDNRMLLFIFNLVGVGSFLIWVILLVTTRVRGLELCRDVLMGMTLFYLAVVFLVKAGQISYFEFKTPVWVLFNMGGVATLAAMVFLIFATWATGREWLATLWCGGAWMVGAAFYLYMPLASMSNPPLNWGYPRTVAGFYHAFTRGQYERIHPTETATRYVEQVGLYIGGLFEEMNFVYVLIALIPFFYLRRMQSRERAWLIGLTVTYVMLSAFLLWLLNPMPDRQSRDLNRVFFTASHFMVAMFMGYGLAILGGYLVTQFERFRTYCLAGTAGAAVFALFMIAVRYHGFDHHSLIIDMDPSYSPIVRFTCWFSLAVALAGVAIFMFARQQVSRTALLTLMCVLPFWSVLSHWYDNEQRGHYFGYWFGHDMFTPPFNDPKTKKPLYPEMDRDTVLYGGTDPGRFNPTYMIFCESFIPPSKRNPQDQKFDRRDVYLITQNALADGTYLNYIRAHYNRSAQIDPPFFSELVRGQRELESGEKTNFLARAMRPLDHYFLGLGDKIEENRRAGSSAFHAEDFTDLPGFTSRIKAAKDPLSKFIFDNLSKETQQLVASGGGSESSTRRALAKELTALIRREVDAWKKLDEKLNEQNGYTNAIANAQGELAGLSSDKTGEKTRAKVKSLVEGFQAKLVPLEKAMAELRAMPSLYETNRFAGITLTPRTQRFVKQDPRSHTRIRLNRILLEEAFPKEIAKSQGGVYPDLEILTASNDDSQRCFSEYLADANRRLQHDRDHPNEPRQIKPGEDVKVIDNKVQVSGQVAVMAINGLLTKVIFDKNPNHEFYVEESFPLDWMYPHLTPYGIIMKINRQPVPELTEDMLYRDHEFWSQFSTRSIGNWITYDTTVSNICDFAEEAYYKRRVPTGFSGDPAFLRDSDGQKAFSKLRSSIAGVYTWRLGEAQKKGNGVEFQRMVKEADFAFKQAYAFCPYSPEAIFRYVNLLVQMGRVDDALLLANTSLKMDPFNLQIDNLLVELNRIKNSMPRNTAPPPAAAIPQEQLNALEAQFKTQPSNFALGFQYVAACIQSQQSQKAIETLDQIVAQPTADPNTLLLAADGFAQVGLVAKVEQTLQQLVKSAPDNPEGRFQLAAFQAMQNKPALALESLSNSLRLSAARLAKDPSAQNLYAAAAADTRLASLRSMPECQQLLDAFKPK